MKMKGNSVVLSVGLCCWASAVFGFQTTTSIAAHSSRGNTRLIRSNVLSSVYMARGSDNQQEEKPVYSQQMLLREETESPFRKIRFFLYASLGAGALTSLAVSLARVAAGLAGVNTDLLQESEINAAVDVAGLIVLGFLWKRDLDAQNSRLKRASKGAELAKLMLRGSKAMIEGYVESSDDIIEKTNADTFTTSLASLRRGRGIEKRVVIAAAGKDKIDEIVKEAIALQDSLSLNDLLVIPVVVPQAAAPANVNSNDLPECLALPVGPSWRVVIEDEAQEALKQNVDIEKEGFCVILNKVGRVGQRTRGIFLDNMVGEVTKRREAGMDVKNI